jgi:hypothetical protein
MDGRVLPHWLSTVVHSLMRLSTPGFHPQLSTQISTMASSKKGWAANDYSLGWLAEVFLPLTKRGDNWRILLVDGYGLHSTGEFCYGQEHRGNRASLFETKHEESKLAAYNNARLAIDVNAKSCSRIPDGRPSRSYQCSCSCQVYTSICPGSFDNYCALARSFDARLRYHSRQR